MQQPSLTTQTNRPIYQSSPTVQPNNPARRPSLTTQMPHAETHTDIELITNPFRTCRFRVKQDEEGRGGTDPEEREGLDTISAVATEASSCAISEDRLGTHSSGTEGPNGEDIVK